MFVCTLLETPNQHSIPSGLAPNYWASFLFVPQDGLERRGYKEAGFLNAVDEVVRTGK